MLKDQTIRSEFLSYIHERRTYFHMDIRKYVPTIKEAKIISANGNRLIQYKIINPEEVIILSNRPLDNNRGVGDYCFINQRDSKLLISTFFNPGIFEYQYRIVEK